MTSTRWSRRSASILLVGPNGLAELREDDYINGNGTTELEGILSLSPDDATLSGEYLSKSVLWAAAIPGGRDRVHRRHRVGRTPSTPSRSAPRWVRWTTVR